MTAHPIILFDSLCVLCSAHARFVIEHDREGRFRLAAMQSEIGAALYRRFGIDPDDPDTLILVEGETALRDSDAVIAIWRGLGGPWRLAVLACLVPRPLRDRLYRWVARHRYGLFGRRDACWRPPAHLRDRLL
jgi:predicted DCC family thiol-disulfide oxidoreductase YuxK